MEAMRKKLRCCRGYCAWDLWEDDRIMCWDVSGLSRLSSWWENCVHSLITKIKLWSWRCWKGEEWTVRGSVSNWNRKKTQSSWKTAVMKDATGSLWLESAKSGPNQGEPVRLTDAWGEGRLPCVVQTHRTTEYCSVGCNWKVAAPQSNNYTVQLTMEPWKEKNLIVFASHLQFTLLSSALLVSSVFFWPAMFWFLISLHASRMFLFRVLFCLHTPQWWKESKLLLALWCFVHFQKISYALFSESEVLIKSPVTCLGRNTTEIQNKG